MRRATTASKALTIAIAPDSFKGTLSATEAAAAIAAGLGDTLPQAKLRLIPMADGGEGSLSAWLAATGARRLSARVSDPLGRPIRAAYGMDERRKVAFIELAEASGLLRLTPDERDPARATTLGTGQLICHALANGARHLLLAIGGSSSNDGGAGIAQALGARLLDRNSQELPAGGAALQQLHRLDLTRLRQRLADVTIEVACDVTNPLYGPHGAAAIYASQKGADKQMVRLLDRAMRHYAAVIARQLGRDHADEAGSGAAGGVGFGMVALCGAKLRSGVAMIAESVDLQGQLQGCDLVITGEGRMDGQSVSGKTPVGVARVAVQFKIPTVAICGALGVGFEKLHDSGIAAIFPATHGSCDPLNLKKGAAQRLRTTAAEVGRLLKLGQSLA